MDEAFGLNVGQSPLLQALHFAREPAKVFLEAEYCAGKLHAEVEAGGMLAAERDHVATEREVVADKYGEPRTELDGHGLVVRGAEPQGRAAVRSLAIGELQDDSTEPSRRKAKRSSSMRIWFCCKTASSMSTSSICGIGLKVVTSGAGSARSSARLTRSVSTCDTSWACCMVSSPFFGFAAESAASDFQRTIFRLGFLAGVT